MEITRRRLLILLPAAAVAWKYVQAGTPEASPNYKMTEHWWGMLIDIPKCIGCGSCVRACSEENDVPDGYFRTWIERYHVTDWKIERPEVESPNGGKQGFPIPLCRIRTVPRMRSATARTSSYLNCATTARTLPAHKFVPLAQLLSLPTAWFSSTRTTASAAATVCRHARTAAASSTPKRIRPRSARSVITASRRD